MELTKGITLFNNKNSIDDCFFNNYNGETIGIYKPCSKKLGAYISDYLEKGYKFIVFQENLDKTRTTIKNLDVTNDFYHFYKKSDLFIVEDLLMSQVLFNEILSIIERIFIFN